LYNNGKHGNTISEVIEMNLHSLIEQNEQARQYFNQLPDYVQEQISSRSDEVTSFERLQGLASNLLDGA